MASEEAGQRMAASLSLVMPVFNEEESLDELYHELSAICTNLPMPCELIFVDDGSRDGSALKIASIAARDERVRAIFLSRNFGHQNALMAGLEAARGEVVISLDSDLQHPPALIPEMLRHWQMGADIVNARRKEAKGATFKRFGSAIFYRLVNKLSDVPIPEGVADFRLYGRSALDALLRLRERDRFNRGLVSWIGFRTAIIEYDESPRRAGSSKYSLFRMLALALSGVTSFSVRPLRIAFLLGLLLSLAGLAYAAYATVQHFRGHTVEGWTSTLLSILIIGGVQLITTGILGEYLARLFTEVKGRPHYIVRESLGDENYLYLRNQKQEEGQSAS